MGHVSGFVTEKVVPKVGQVLNAGIRSKPKHNQVSVLRNNSPTTLEMCLFDFPLTKITDFNLKRTVTRGQSSLPLQLLGCLGVLLMLRNLAKFKKVVSRLFRCATFCWLVPAWPLKTAAAF